MRVLLLDRGFSAAEAEAAPWLLAGAKTLSYGVNMAALRYAAEHDADDVIFVGSDGAVLEAPTASVVVARGRTLLTPPSAGNSGRHHRAPAVPGGGRCRLAHRQPVLTAADLRPPTACGWPPARDCWRRSIAIDGVERSDGGLTAGVAALLEVPVCP